MYNTSFVLEKMQGRTEEKIILHLVENDGDVVSDDKIDAAFGMRDVTFIEKAQMPDRALSVNRISSRRRTKNIVEHELLNPKNMPG